LSIIGPTGPARSSIFNLISRIYNPTRAAFISRMRTSRRRPAFGIAKSGIARTFQNIELFENATVLSNLLVGRHGISTTTALAGDCCFCRACAPPKSPSAAGRAGIEFSIWPPTATS